MRYIILLITVVFGMNMSLSAQSDISELEANQYFDFWVGEWELSWTDNQGNPGAGTNTIEKVLDDVVIQENFEATE
ncbi:MAG TPA: hypothetical protein DEG32_10965, partial [Balneolaceae bacterium]|nr:hypothetical protein [Balneolaceae bacterium]